MEAKMEKQGELEGKPYREIQKLARKMGAKNAGVRLSAKKIVLIEWITKEKQRLDEMKTRVGAPAHLAQKCANILWSAAITFTDSFR